MPIIVITWMKPHLNESCHLNIEIQIITIKAIAKKLIASVTIKNKQLPQDYYRLQDYRAATQLFQYYPVHFFYLVGHQCSHQKSL